MTNRAAHLLVLAVAFGCSGDGNTGPPLPSALRFQLVGAGYFHSCGLTRTGSAYCWGGNDEGTVGDGTRTLRTRPTLVAGGNTWRALAVGAGHSCALGAGGEARCWGHNDEGQLGDATFLSRDLPAAVVGALSFAAISAGHAHSCGLRADGSTWCWGDDSRGQLGDGGPGAEPRSAAPVRALLTQPLASVVAGYYQTCGLTTTGAAYCWGANGSGQNGDGTTEDRHQPMAVAGGHTFTAIAAGDRFVCGISSGAAWCWGANRSGELGVGGNAGSSVPIRVDGAPALAVIAAANGVSTVPGAAAYACGVAAEGRAWCWGGAIRALRTAAAEPGALGPATLKSMAVAAGAQHVCLLDTQGYVYCGGANYSGQLGDGTRTDRAALVPIPGPED